MPCSSRIASVFAFALLALACQQGKEEESRAALRQTKPTPTERGTTADPDPTLANWETEVFASAAGIELVEIKRFLRGGTGALLEGTSQRLTGFHMTSIPEG